VVEEKNQSSDKELNERVDLVILSNAKHMGLSFEELNEFTLNEFMIFSDIWLGKEKKNEVKKATQKDIDNFYRYM
jgi:hypothetical protein